MQVGEGAASAEATEGEAVRSLNRAFYEAFESDDFDAISAIWEHSDRVQCVHPGWSILRGWSEVGASWKAMVEGPGQLQFVLTNDDVQVDGDVAWVTLDENIIGDGPTATVAVVNMFARQGDGSWRMIAHHGSAIMMPQRRYT